MARLRQAPTLADRLIARFDAGLRSVSGLPTARHERDRHARPSPAGNLPEAPLDPDERRHAAGLMRVNHAGEVCAQALYAGQSLTASRRRTRGMLEHAAREEEDHLDWCGERLRQLDARPSVLNPLWYSASFAIGAVVGFAGDRVSLGFVEATEDGVAEHLEGHLQRLPEQDARSRAIVEQMRVDEQRHGETATAAGGQVYAVPVKQAMRAIAGVMTALSYRL